MRYSYDYKRKAVELYRQGQWPDTPEDINTEDFHETIRRWARIEESCGPEALRHKGRKPRKPNMKKVGTRKPPKLNESEYEELIRLRAENEYMKAEIEVIKKEIALREEIVHLIS